MQQADAAEGPDITGRHIFGADVEGYQNGRPLYPDAVYQALQDIGALYPGGQVFELGPGTGQATKRLLGFDIGGLTAIEPDAKLAEHLRTIARDDPRLTVCNMTAEEAPVAPASFDLGIAATAFHWLDQASGLRRVADLLRPGGWWAMWWNIVHDPANDPFSAAVVPLLEGVTLPPSLTGPSHRHYALDTQNRLDDLAVAGFVDMRAMTFRTEVPMSAAQMRTLYATFSMIRRLEAEKRAQVLNQIEALGVDQFGDRIERVFLTPLFLARMPDVKG